MATCSSCGAAGYSGTGACPACGAVTWAAPDAVALSTQRLEVRARQREALEAGRRQTMYVLLGLGGLFSVLGVGFVVGALAAGAGPFALFGLIWFVASVPLLYFGLRSRAGVRLRARLRQSGVRGVGRVQAMRETNVRVNGAPLYELTLAIEAPGVPPWITTVREAVPRGAQVVGEGTVPVLVEAGAPPVMMIDWFAPPEGQ